MSWIKTPSSLVAAQIDKIFENEKGENFYTMAPLTEAKNKKLDRVKDRMHVYLSDKWVKHENISSLDDRRAYVRQKANRVMKSLSNPAASAAVNRATVEVMDQLSHRAKNNIPLHASVVPGTGRTYNPSVALSTPASDAGNALARSPSLSGSALSNPEQIAYEP